jgi:protease-4
MTLIGTLKNIGYIALFILLLPLVPLFIHSVQKLYNRYLDPRAHVAVLPINGVLYDSGYYTKNLHHFFKDPGIKAILLKMECNGSASGTGQAIFNEIMTLKKIYPKPVVALIENCCASGGYYIASGADYIIASPMALVGSIGVTFSPLFQLRFKEFVEQYKIKTVPMAAGDFKNTTNPLVDMTAEQQQMLQDALDDDYVQFTTDVAAARNLDIAKAPEWANGKIFSGVRAHKLGLVDQLGSSSQALAFIEAKIGTGEFKWTYAPSKFTIWNLLGGESDDTQDSLFSSCINQMCTTLENRYSKCVVQ